MSDGFREVRFGELVTGTELGGVYPGQSDPTATAVLKMGAMARGHIVASALEYLPNGVEADSDHVLRPGDLLFNTRNSLALVGKVSLWRGEATRAVFDNNIMRLTFDKEAVVSTEFSNILLNSVPVLRQLRRRAIGTTSVAAIYWRDLQRMSILLPPRGMQKAAISVEHALRRLTDNLDALGGAKRAFKNGLMQQLLTGQKRFPGFLGTEWAEVYLGDVFLERTEANRPDLPLLSVTGDRGLIPRDEIDKRDTSNPDKSKYKRVAIGDIAYNTMRMWQGVSALAHLEGIISPAYTVAIPSTRISGRYAKHLFKYPPIINLFHRHSQGLVDDTLNLKFHRFAKIRLPIPSEIAEQERIADVLDVVDVEIELLSALGKQFDVYKRGLLSRLLSGELQVPA